MKSENPLHPSYLPTIFPEKVLNVKKSTQSLERFERQKSRSNKVTNIKESAINNCTEIEQHNNNYIEIEQYNRVEISMTNTISRVYRSITCQTDERMNEPTYFFFAI